jgi:aspartate/methionine/tyrosine aminotransferase
MESLNRIEQTYRKLTAEGKPVLKLFSGNPNDAGFHFPSDILKRSYDRYFETQDYHPHPKGLLEARRAISDFYAAQSVSIDPENILLTSGTSESFLHLFSLLTRPGDNILAPSPAYPLFDEIARLAGIELRHYRLEEKNGWKVDLENLRSQQDSRTKAVILVSPNNPTGAVISKEELLKIVEWTNQKEIPLVCDEVFSEFYFGAGNFPRTIGVAKPKLAFTLNGISKMFALPALKLSWIAVTGEKNKVEPVVDRLETVNDTFLSCHVPIQKALPSLFSEGKEFLEFYRKEVGHRRELAASLLKKIPEIGFVEPVGGFYLTAEVTKNFGFSEEEFVIRLMEEEGVFVHPGYFYDYEKGTHLVISCLSDPERLKEGLLKLQSFIKRYK